MPIYELVHLDQKINSESFLLKKFNILQLRSSPCRLELKEDKIPKQKKLPGKTKERSNLRNDIISGALFQLSGSSSTKSYRALGQQYRNSKPQGII